MQAEEDLTWVAKYRKAMAEEAELMKHVPDWKVRRCLGLGLQ